MVLPFHHPHHPSPPPPLFQIIDGVKHTSHVVIQTIRDTATLLKKKVIMMMQFCTRMVDRKAKGLRTWMMTTASSLRDLTATRGGGWMMMKRKGNDADNDSSSSMAKATTGERKVGY